MIRSFIVVVSLWSVVVIASGENANNQHTLWQDLFFSGLLSAIVAASISTYVLRKVNREKLSIDVAKDFQSIYESYWEACDSLHKKEKTTRDERRTIRFVGNWLEIFSVLIRRQRLDEKLIDDLGLRSNLKQFDMFMTRKACTDCQIRNLYGEHWCNIKAVSRKT